MQTDPQESKKKEFAYIEQFENCYYVNSNGLFSCYKKVYGCPHETAVKLLQFNQQLIN